VHHGLCRDVSTITVPRRVGIIFRRLGIAHDCRRIFRLVSMASVRPPRKAVVSLCVVLVLTAELFDLIALAVNCKTDRAVSRPNCKNCSNTLLWFSGSVQASVTCCYGVIRRGKKRPPFQLSTSCTPFHRQEQIRRSISPSTVPVITYVVTRPVITCACGVFPRKSLGL
jgi:hypothetical protein